MSANLPTTSGCGLLLVLALAAIADLGAGFRPATAQTLDRSVPAELRRADELFRAEKLQQAEGLYQRILSVAGGEDRRHCFDQLLLIYGRVGRLDQAIQTAQTYREWMHRSGDTAQVRELDLELGRWHYALGHYADAERHLEQARAVLRRVPLPPAREFTALTYLALAAEKQGDHTRAGQAWREVEAFALARLDDRRQKLDLRVECARRLADSYRFQGQPKKAIPWLEQILLELDELKDAGQAIRRDTLRQLAGHLAIDGRYADAEKRLKQALELHRQCAPRDKLTHADLSGELADVLHRQGRTREDDAEALRNQAAKDYQEVIDHARAGRPDVAGALDAFWKLQLLYQRTSQYERAMELIGDQTTRWAGGLIEPRLHTEQGTLRILLGQYPRARQLLDGAVGDLEKQSPANLVALPPALLNLAIAELATRDPARAEELGGRCQDLYRKHHLAPDMVLVETYNLLGACAAYDGDYARAISHFRAGVDQCKKLGSPADAPHCNLLLNIALLHKAQGDLDPALQACEQARDVYKQFASPDARGFAALDAATATLLAAQGRLKESYDLAANIQERYAENVIKGGPLMTALHCQALFHLSKNNFHEADRLWRKLETLQGRDSPLQPRTLNYLGLTCERQGRLDEAATLYKQALDLQADSPLALPATHFITLWRLADVTDQLAKRVNSARSRAEARSLLEKAVTLAEQARLRTYGGPRQRANFFAQFAPAFEQLVEWYVRDDDVAKAVVTAARGRSLTLLDQMLLGNADPRQDLPEGDKLRQEEVELRQQIAALFSQAQLADPEDLKTPNGRKLLVALAAAQNRYVDVYSEILNSSPLYRKLRHTEFTDADLDRLRKLAIGPKRLLLVYHVGRERSYLLLLRDRSRRPEAFALTVPADVAARIATPAPVSLALALRRSRGVELEEREGKQPDLPAPLSTSAIADPLGKEALRALVENYLLEVTARKFQPTGGWRLRPRNPDRALAVQSPTLLGSILLPPAARERIRALAPECVIVVPDGALHKLPFEALLLPTGDRPAYVLDELPPLAYAPSVAILARLTERKAAAPDGIRSLLTVADPAYPPAKLATRPAARPGLLSGPTPAVLWGQFPALLHAARESERVSDCFDRKQVKALTGAGATKKALIAYLPERHVLHIAAHGVADESFDNQFGALVLTPPPEKEGPPSNGFLSLHEIYALDLKDCELAVLSACVTNVGPQRPLEAGVTLASGFLAAGARRVVASHWGVDDESTAELMAAFFEKLKAAKPGELGAYAKALQNARKQLRKLPGFAAPYYWAPFVLVGPAD